jgi:2,4-dienoyl-CoA reductase-like NADH-dependent reductase (Old Yellow Enzyme family)
MYSADGENALRLLKRILDGIKEVVPDDFVLGIKINSADYFNSQMSSDEADNEEKRITEHITSTVKWGVLDFIEISGGNYESPSKFLETFLSVL